MLPLCVYLTILRSKPLMVYISVLLVIIFIDNPKMAVLSIAWLFLVLVIVRAMYDKKD